jgi:hypothetical protein
MSKNSGSGLLFFSSLHFFWHQRVSYWSQYIRVQVAPGSSYVLTVLMYWLQYDPPVWTWNLCTGSNMTPLSRL